MWPFIKNAHGEEGQRIEFKHGLLTTYTTKLNAFSFRKSRFAIRIPLRVIGVPPSLSISGYHTDDTQGISEIAQWIKSQKGHTIILNADNTFDGIFAKTSTLPSVLIQNNFTSYEDYLSKMRSHYRYRFLKAQKRFETVTVIENPTFNASLYALYEAVYARSTYPLVKNTYDFFKSFPGKLTAFYAGEMPIGFCQYHIADDALIFMFCGLDYKALKTYDTYLNLLQYLVARGIEHGVKTIDLGQTTEEIKLKLGGSLKPLNLYYHHHNVIMRILAKRIMPLLGYTHGHPDYHVFKNE